jgi:hypothetical protein
MLVIERQADGELTTEQHLAHTTVLDIPGVHD